VASPSRTCFVVGPIGKRGSKERIHADTLFNKIIKPAFASVRKNVHVVRADHISTPGMIDSQIVTHLIEARLVIADLSTRNPNAFYELGIRHMANKPVIHIYKRGERIPADVSLFRAVEISYSSAVAIGKSRAELAKAIKETFLPGFAVENPVTQSKGFQKRLNPPPPKMVKPKPKSPPPQSPAPPIPPPPPPPAPKSAQPGPPRIDGAVNLVWKIRPGGIWEARWQAPPDFVGRGFKIKSVKLMSARPGPLTSEETEFLRDTTLQLQDEVTRWLKEQSS
jgi:hypothetical protein